MPPAGEQDLIKSLSWVCPRIKVRENNKEFGGC
jgi:hypothetical protein